MREKIKNLIFKLKDYDRLYEVYEGQKAYIDELNIYIQKLDIDISDLRRDLNIAKKDNTELYEKIHDISVPKKNMQELEKNLILADTYTLKIIIDYLKLDSYELIKNIASRINKDNIDNFIAYRDGCLSRNESLKELLLKHINKRDSYSNRITGEDEDK